MQQAQEVEVRLTPLQARHVAGTLRLELGMRWEAVAPGPVPCRDDIRRARALFDEYDEQLERLGWGEPSGDVRVRWRADAIRGLVRDLRQAAEECYADSMPEAGVSELLDAAQALARALRPKPPLAAAS